MSDSSYLRSAGPSRERLWSGVPADAQDIVCLGRLARERGGAEIGLEHEKILWQVAGGVCAVHAGQLGAAQLGHGGFSGGATNGQRA